MALTPPATTNDWPVDVVPIYAWRQAQVIELRDNPSLAFGAFEYYRNNPTDFINHWCETYDPRRSVSGQTKLPLVLFERQHELVEFLLACVVEEQPGLIEKSRDMGATWERR